jgi:hypothetical protein
MSPNLRAALVALAMLAAAQPVSANDHPYPPATYCQQDPYAPVAEAIAACMAEALQNPNANPPTPGPGVLGSALAPVEGGECPWPGVWYIDRGDTENKWTPLYGANSPAQGRGEFVTSSSSGVELDIRLSFRGVGAKMSYEQTSSGGEGLGAENGKSRVNYQYISWTEFTGYVCGDNNQWYEEGPWLWPTNYEPNGFPEEKTGNQEGSSLSTDWDNPMYPTNSGFTQATTIGVDMAYYTKDRRSCPGTTQQEYWFGKSSVFKVGARIQFKGAFEAGGAYVRGESNTFRYTYSGCYWIDHLGDDAHDVGWAFHSDPYHYPDGECRPEYQEECDEENHVPPRGDSALEPCNTGSTPLGHEATSQLCAPARPTPCEVLGGPLRNVVVDVNTLQQAWLQQADPSPESKADLLETLCEAGKPMDCGELCQVDACAEVAGVGQGDLCARVAEEVPDVCQHASLCQPGSTLCPANDSTTGPASTPLCDDGWSGYQACDWDTIALLDGNAARDLACDGNHPEPRPLCDYVPDWNTCPPACQGSCQEILDAAGNTDPCDTQAPPSGEYAWNVACAREDFDACEAGNGLEETYLCGGRSPLDPE